MGGLSAILGMGTKFKDKIVLQGCREGYCEYGPATGISCWLYHILGESYLTHLSNLMGSKADSRFGDPLSFLEREDFSILILWTLCQKAMRAEVEGLILFSWWLRVFYLAGGWRWHGAKNCLGSAEISPNVFGRTQDKFRISSLCCWCKWRE